MDTANLTAANEQAQLTINSADDFDQHVAFLVKKKIQHLTPLLETLDNVRVAAETNSVPLPAWPRHHVFVCMDAVISLYSQLLQAQVIAPSPETAGNEDILDPIVYDPSLTCALAPFNKLRTVLHVKPSIKEILEKDPELLNVESSFIANMPQWAVCLNLVDHNCIWNNTQVAGVIFARYFITHDPQQNQVDLSANLAGEPAAATNNMMSVVIDVNGGVNLGPFIQLTNTMTIKENFAFLKDHITKQVLDGAEAAKANGENVDDNAIKALIEDSQQTMDRSAEIFGYLAYAIKNINNTVDKRGELCLVPKNPQPTDTKDGPKLFGADRTTVLYIN